MIKKTSTGIGGLDNILFGGVPQRSTVLLEGAPGTGKTTVGLQYLFQGIVENDESGIYITFEELPEQIYEDALQFGWDLRALEQKNKLRILCMSPDVLIEQMLHPDGLFEKIVSEIQCKRVVIDSVTVLRNDAKMDMDRNQFYRLRNILRKFKLTSFLIEEQQDAHNISLSYQHYIVDGVIRLSLQEWRSNYKQRMLEVTKMRGTRIFEGEHVYRITKEGIYLIPARSMIEDIAITDQQQKISTGITRLDQLLGGGISQGSVLLLDTNSKANYKYLVASITTRRLLSDEKVIYLPSNIVTPVDLQNMWQLFNVSLEEEISKNSVYFLEHYNRSYPKEFEHSVISLGDLNDEEYLLKRKEKLDPIITESLRNKKQCFIYYDLNTIFNERGKDFVIKFFAQEIAKARSLGITVMILCNFAEMDAETSSFLERSSNGVIRTWVDGRYQYLQVTKTPHGQMSEPLIVENIPEAPYLRLI
jgi:circadian clock protein KaiC